MEPTNPNFATIAFIFSIVYKSSLNKKVLPKHRG